MKRNLLGAVLILSTFTLVSYVAKSPSTRHDVQQPTLADGTGPIQTCRPGTNCNPDDQLRQMADGTGPIQTCRPGTNCNPDDQLRQTTTKHGTSYFEIYAG
jgi:hypothetical protein